MRPAAHHRQWLNNEPKEDQKTTHRSRTGVNRSMTLLEFRAASREETNTRQKKAECIKEIKIYERNKQGGTCR
jgi:hypothetical protein